MTFLSASINGFAKFFLLFGEHADIVPPPELTREEIKELPASIKLPALNNYCLIEIIKNLIVSITHTRNIQFELNSHQLDEKPLTDAHRILVYRLIQEQLSNTIKYANATKVAIVFRWNS